MTQTPGPTVTADAVRLSVDGAEIALDPTWLRDRCACAECRDAGSGQRLFDIADLPVGLRVESARVSGGVLTVRFAPEGHETSLLVDELLGADRPQRWADVRSEAAKRLWRSAADLGTRSGHAWSAHLADPVPAMRELALDGLTLLTGSSTTEGTVLRIAESFGHVRTTNYGTVFDVRVEESPTNLAFTSRAIGPHTDNPYRDPVPTIQLLHCLRNDAAGGRSGLVDGFAAAVELRRTDPEAFEVLASTPVGYAFDSADAGLRTHLPIVGLDVEGRIREIRFNNRSMRVPRMPLADSSAFYAAYRRFAALLAEPAACLRFTLRPGDCVVFDNTRVLHARTAFESGGGRHLQGAYADLDAVFSRLAVAERSR